jgi:GrpB-like predicted nucleotidyltransferase (UPF0157 family)
MDYQAHELGIIGGTEKRPIVIVDYDPGWPEMFRHHADKISAALGDRAIQVEHIGSTSVPGLAAKPIIDIVLAVQDSSNEDSYLASLIAAGYELRVREPEWNEHRMFRTLERDVHLHVFSDGSSEIERNIEFRDWLRIHEDDRKQYESVKRSLASEDWPIMQAYADAKTDVIQQIIARIDEA